MKNKQQATSLIFNLPIGILMLLIVIVYSRCQIEKPQKLHESTTKNETFGKNGLIYTNEEDSFFVEQDIARIYA